ncbi:MAG: M67 family metallopeptidase [Gemmatimonadota bacterium]
MSPGSEARRELQDAALEIGSGILSDILEAAAAGYPREACGILLGQLNEPKRIVEGYRPTPNRWPERGDRYLIDPEALRRALGAEEAGGPRVLGFYHSHPDAPPVPSETDRELAWPWYYYVIIPVAQGTPGEARVWELDPEAGRFVERSLAPA